MPLRIKRADLDAAIEAFLICATTATDAQGLRIMYRIEPIVVEKHLLGLLAALTPSSMPDTAQAEDIGYANLGEPEKISLSRDEVIVMRDGEPIKGFRDVFLRAPRV